MVWRAGITHIINCAGMTSPNAFPATFEYTTLYMNDVPTEDIIRHLYRVVTVIDQARAVGGKVKIYTCVSVCVRVCVCVCC